MPRCRSIKMTWRHLALLDNGCTRVVPWRIFQGMILHSMSMLFSRRFFINFGALNATLDKYIKFE